MGTRLCALSAVALSRGLAERAYSADDVAKDLLDLIDDRNVALNALVTLDRADVLAQATASAERYRCGAALSPLDGVPVSVKDNLWVRGVRATWGSRLFETFVPDRDEIAVERLRAAGAVILGKTNTPEFAMASVTENPVFGVTRNPLDLALTPGGSSGGAAAQIASGMGPLALVTDAGGSTRRPASFCGIVGFKPGIGTVPRTGGFPPLAHDFQVVGTLARSVADVRVMHRVIAGADSRDPSSVTTPPGDRLGARKVLFAVSLGGHPVDKPCREAAVAAVKAMSSLGYDVEPVEDLWDPDEVEELFGLLIRVGVARAVAPHNDWQTRVTPPIRSLAEQGAVISATQYLDALDRIRALREAFDRRMVDVHSLVTPVAASGAWSIGYPAPPSIEGKDVPASAGRIFSTAVNLLGLPALSIPAAIDEAGMPFGAQIVMARQRDCALLDLGVKLEDRLAFDHLKTAPQKTLKEKMNAGNNGS